VITILNFL